MRMLNNLVISAAFDLLEMYSTLEARRAARWHDNLARWLVAHAKLQGWNEGWEEGGSPYICAVLDIQEEEEE